MFSKIKKINTLEKEHNKYKEFFTNKIKSSIDSVDLSSNIIWDSTTVTIPTFTSTPEIVVPSDIPHKLRILLEKDAKNRPENTPLDSTLYINLDDKYLITYKLRYVKPDKFEVYDINIIKITKQLESLIEEKLLQLM